jgi:hypothetical protein
MLRNRGASNIFLAQSLPTIYATLFWLGDQLQSWDAYSGIKTAVVELLSGGVSGFSLLHSDTGGYDSLQFHLAGKEIPVLAKSPTVTAITARSALEITIVFHGWGQSEFGAFVPELWWADGSDPQRPGDVPLQGTTYIWLQRMRGMGYGRKPPERSTQGHFLRAEMA